MAVLEALFVSTVSQTIVCPRCQHRSTTNNIHTSMQVPFLGPAPLVNLIGSSAVLGPDNYPSRLCGDCDVRSDSNVYRRIVTPPEILAVQIYRFVAHPSMQSAEIPFSDRLDLSPYIEGRASLKYRLLAVVDHFGTLNFGHYITAAKGPGGNWEEIDDTRVRPISTKVAVKPDEDFDPYVLFYERECGPVPVTPIRAHDQRFWEDRERDLATARATMRQNGTSNAPKKSYRITKPGKSKN